MKMPLMVSGLMLLFGSATAPRQEAAGPRQEAGVEELGRLLFWDPILSGAEDVACATCHHPDFAYADGRELSLGSGAVGLGPGRMDPAGRGMAGVR